MQTQEITSVRSPAQLLAVVPKLCGFTPEDSLVIIGLGEDSQVVVTLRYDLPGPSGIAGMEQRVQHAATVLDGHADALVAVVYGGEDCGISAAAVLDALDELPVLELLRVQDGRYWSYLCTDPTCCPPEGTPFMAEALAGREQIAAQVAPVTGERAEVMRRRVRGEVQRVADMPKRAVQVGMDVVQVLISEYRDGHLHVSTIEAATAVVALRSLRVRDDAWSRMVPEHNAAHIQMWTDLTRLAPPGFVAAPASLLAFVAWQSGNGALANVALDRALADDPDYSMAQLLRQVITAGAPPSLARPAMTPEEVAASYEEDR